ncbi:unnamed protein product [Paramecium octaurelia]|uniref:Amino acid transporter transmembrane domain-containing protein n=1 Tax=Paramecium octaurelia TaxID=43137 RepID=A0A8S1WA07_PAROT|nr:unnamed protein product [Paramecium octaurelia]
MNKSSLIPIFTLSNGMIGSAPIVLPVLYNQYGFLNGVVFSFIICLASCTTCLIVKKYHLKKEVDLQFLINRILGPKFQTTFNFITIIFYIACAQIQVIISCSLIYSVISLFVNSAPQNVFTFTQFSYQILGMIYILILLPTFFIKDITPLLKLPTYASLATLLAVVFIIFQGSQTPTISTWKSNDIAVLPSVFQLAFLGHSLVVPLLSKSESKHKSRDIIIAYILTFSIYQVVGLFGSYALFERKPQDGLSGFTILDYFPQSQLFVIILQILLFIQISLLLPIIQYVARLRFFAFFNAKNPKPYMLIIFSFVFAFICLFFEMMNLNLENLISYTGAIIGTIIGFLIPIACHIKIKYFSKKQVQEFNLIESSQELKPRRIGKLEIVFDILGCGIILSIGLSVLVLRFIYV